MNTRQKDFHIAPMLAVSKPEFLNFMRILSKRAILWTEMIVDETIAYSNDLDLHLGFEPHLKPIICQIGGRNAELCGKATVIAESYGYDEVNLNVDCPSSRVSGKRKFGAVLMHDDIACTSVVSAMNAKAKDVPISVKTRVGIELENGEVFDSMDHLKSFIEKLRICGCHKFVIHARKCVLGGLSPAQNRLVPPLNYPRVYELCRSFPDCEFVLNGGIPGLKASKILCDGVTSGQICLRNQSVADEEDGKDDRKHAVPCSIHAVPCSICNNSNGSCTSPPLNSPNNLTGVMLGRALTEVPSMFWDIDRYFYGETSNPCSNRREVLDKYCEYLEYTYPHRCCDNDERITSRIPAPKIELFHDGKCEFCGRESSCGPVNDEKPMGKQNNSKIKITTCVVDRSMKPILNMFFGLPKSRMFRRECDRLGRDKTIRNCGPAFILKSVLSKMPCELLDQPFIKTEELDNADIPVHSGPSISNCKGCR